MAARAEVTKEKPVIRTSNKMTKTFKQPLEPVRRSKRIKKKSKKKLRQTATF